MKRLIAFFLAVVLCISLVSCSQSIGIIGGADGETQIYVSDNSEEKSLATPLLYKATDKDGNVAWLLGAIHIGKADFYPLPDYVMDAYESSNALAIECDTVDFEKVFDYMQYTDGSTIKDHIDTQLYDAAVQILEEHGVREQVSDSYIPAAWAVYIDKCAYEKMGYKQQYGVDSYFENLATDNNKKLLEVEGDEIHGKSMAKLSEKAQEMMLMSSVSGYHSTESVLKRNNKSMDIWAKGDEAEIIANTYSQTIADVPQEQKSLFEEYYQVIRYDRNDHMVEYVKKAMVDEKEVFVCVGIAHIVGDTAMVDQLRQQGYTVEIVK